MAARDTKAVSRALAGALFATVILAVAQAAEPPRLMDASPPVQSAVMRAPLPALAQPAISRVFPNRVEAGRVYSLTLDGSGFAAGMTASFTPEGVDVLGPVIVRGPTSAQLQVQVRAGAAAGFRNLTLLVPAAASSATTLAAPPPRRVQLTRAIEVTTAPNASTSVTAPTFEAPVTTTAPPALGDTATFTPTDRGPSSLPKITGVMPAAGEAGSSQTLQLQGSALTQGMRFDFGSDIGVVGEPVLLGTNQVRLKVQISPDARPGPHRVRLGAHARAQWVQQQAVFIVTPRRSVPTVVAGGLPKPQIQPLDFSTVLKERIDLLQPAWKMQTGTTLPPKDPVTGQPLSAPVAIWKVAVPALREGELFSWKERNPNVAEHFEVRFYRGGQRVATRRIDPDSAAGSNASSGGNVPTWLRIDAALLAQILTPRQPARPGSAGSTTGALAGPKYSTSSVAVSSVAATPEDRAMATADLYWEVAGLRRYAPSGVIQRGAGGTAKMMTEVEVEISERWPLLTPYQPTGLACGQDLIGRFGLVNLSKEGVSSTHPGDLMRLTGEFSLSKSPYVSQPTPSTTAMQGKPLLTSWSFDNVYVDWGDGTQQPFTMWRGGDGGHYSPDTELSLGEQGWTHRYQEPGNYVVRVYQLPATAAQSAGAQVVSVAQDRPDTLYQKTLLFDDGGSAVDHSPAGSQAMADSAFMLYCQNVSVAPRTDSDANGPLKLVRIDVQGFPWAAPAQQQGKSGGGGAPSTGGNSTPADLARSARQSMVAAASLFGTGAGGTPAFSACDVSLTAGAALTYVGQGSARLRWKLDGRSFHEETYDDIGPSPSRTQAVLARDPAKQGPPLEGVRENLLSAAIPLDTPGRRNVSVEAEVIYSTRLPGLRNALAAALGAGGRQADARAAQAILSGAEGGPKIGVLSPYSWSGAGLPPVTYVNDSLMQLAARAEPILLAATAGALPRVMSVGGALGKVAGSLIPEKKPPGFVESGPTPFAVVGHDTEAPCTFDFPVTGGRFIVGGLQEQGKSKVTHEGNVFSGNGVLQMPVPGQPGKRLPLPLSFKGWSVASDGHTVEEGRLEAGAWPGGELVAGGVAYTIEKLGGTARQDVKATLKSRLAQANLQSAASQVPLKLPSATAVLSPEGDWYAPGLGTGPLALYDSGFTLAPKSVALDLSAAEGEAPDPSCAGTGIEWMGVHLGAGATLTAYDFDLPGESTGTADRFGIDSRGLCGTAHVGAHATQQLRGQFRWDGIDINASHGQFKAVYQNLRVRVPWLDAELKGTTDPLLEAGEGAGVRRVSLDLVGGPVKRKYGPISFEAQNLQLVKLEGMVPAVRSDTRFDFAGERGVFARDVWVKDLHFGLDGRAYFAPGTTAVKVNLGGQNSASGAVSMALDDVMVSTQASGAQRLDFFFTGRASISKALESARMSVRYGIAEPDEGHYAASGPVAQTMEPFLVSFPKADGTVKASIDVQSASEAGAIRYRGAVDMNLFDLPMKAAFALGYEGNDDFWAMKAVYDGFGPNGAPLLPPFLSLYAVGGGLGYNVSLESLKGHGLESLGYSSSGGAPVFNAAATVGTPDAFILGGRGDLSIKVAGSDPGVRLDFGVFVLSSRSTWISGSPPFEGYMKFQGGSFDGELWGGLDLFGGKAGVTVPKGAAQLHFGSDDWHAYLGKDSGPRVQGHALFIKGNAYLMLSPSRLALGGGADMEASLGDCDDLCAYVKGQADAGLLLATSPLKLAGTARVSVSAGGCYDGACAGVGGDVDAYAELPGPVMRYGFSIDLPCPVPDVGLTLKVLPSPGLSPDLDWCDMNPLW